MLKNYDLTEEQINDGLVDGGDDGGIDGLYYFVNGNYISDKSAVTLSTFGYYEVYVSALADIDLSILLPMLIGVIVGGIVISYIMTSLLNRWYTATFSVIFGLFLSMIPNMLNESCVLGLNGLSVISIVVMILGFGVSYYLGTIESSKS